MSVVRLTPNVKPRATLTSGHDAADQGAREPAGFQPDAATPAPDGFNVSLASTAVRRFPSAMAIRNEMRRGAAVSP